MAFADMEMDFKAFGLDDDFVNYLFDEAGLKGQIDFYFFDHFS